MLYRHQLKQSALILLLFVCIAGHAQSPSFAASLFTGIDAIQPLPLEGNTQTIRVASDLPFQYQIIPLNHDQVLVRFLNARLSANLQSPNGVLPIQTENSGITSATVHISDDTDSEEIVLIGHGLGRRNIILEGGEEVIVNPNELARYKVADPNIPVTKTARAPQNIFPSTTSPSTYALAQSNAGIQFPLYGQKRKASQATGSMDSAEPLPQSAPVRLPRPSFQPLVESNGALDAAADNAGWQESYDPIPTLPTLIPTMASQMPAQNQSEEQHPELEPQQPLLEETNVQAPEASPAFEPQAYQPMTMAEQTSEHQDNESLLRPKIAIQPKPRLELALDERSPKPFNSKKPLNRPTRETSKPSKPASMPVIPAHTSNGQKPVIHFPSDVPETRTPPLQATGYPIQPVNPEPVYETSEDDSKTVNPVYTAPTYPIQQAPETNYNALAYATPVNMASAISRAREQFESHRYEAAETTLESALQLNPKDASLYAALGELYIQQRRFPNAQMAYGQAYGISQNNYAVRYAQVLVLTQQQPQAIGVLKKLLSQKNAPLKDTEETGRAHYMLGTLYEEVGDTQAALPHLQQAAQYLPQDADIQYNLALAYELSGKAALAKAHYSKATQLNPTAKDAQQGLQRVMQF